MFSHFRLQEIRAWQHFSNLRCDNIGRGQMSPKFLKPEMRKHRQGSNFPQIPKICATIARALPIDARSLGILGKFDPCRCFRISGFRNFGEIRAWQHFSNLRCDNIGRIKFLQNYQNLRNYSPITPHRCQEFRNFGEVRSMPMFSHFRLQEFWGNSSLAALFSNLRCEKHRQGL